MTLVPDRRTLIVLASLVGAMTLASGLLLLLEPSVPGGTHRGLPLRQVHTTKRGGNLFDTPVRPEPGRWQAIVVHDSGAPVGSASTLDRAHRRLGRGGLGYHFVINNGPGSDGHIERGPRWRKQDDGAHSGGAQGNWFNRHAIGVCLIGDTSGSPPTAAQVDQLVWLVQRLQMELRISSDRVYLPPDVGPAKAGATHFPVEQVRSQLLSWQP